VAGQKAYLEDLQKSNDKRVREAVAKTLGEAGAKADAAAREHQAAVEKLRKEYDEYRLVHPEEQPATPPAGDKDMPEWYKKEKAEREKRDQERERLSAAKEREWQEKLDVIEKAKTESESKLKAIEDARTREASERAAAIQASITHNHSEGVKGAQAASAAIFLARMGKGKEEIKRYVESAFGYDLSRTCDRIRPSYTFNESCQGTVPEAVTAFLESTDFESCLRLAVSLGGDSDTLTCIAAGIAEAYYKDIPQWMVNRMWRFLPESFREVIWRMHSESCYREVRYIPAKGAPLPGDGESRIGMF
jgi:hypothetical protein